MRRIQRYEVFTVPYRISMLVRGRGQPRIPMLKLLAMMLPTKYLKKKEIVQLMQATPKNVGK